MFSELSLGCDNKPLRFHVPDKYAMCLFYVYTGTLLYFLPRTVQYILAVDMMLLPNTFDLTRLDYL